MISCQSATSVTECALCCKDNACTNMVQPLFPLFVEGCSVLLVRFRFYALVYHSSNRKWRFTLANEFSYLYCHIGDLDVINVIINGDRAHSNVHVTYIN